MVTKDYHEKKHYLVYMLNGVTYLPHYRNPNRYVAPGWSRHPKTYEGGMLFALGARTRMEYLWKRQENDVNARFI